MGAARLHGLVALGAAYASYRPSGTVVVQGHAHPCKTVAVVVLVGIGLTLVAFGALVLLRFPDRPGLLLHWIHELIRFRPHSCCDRDEYRQDPKGYRALGKRWLIRVHRPRRLTPTRDTA
ncbi:MAG TPA: hypothetical protein VFV02_08370 [Acidimicrobiales bacterium]|nr:hypothetical protein [Acidimicrobiales bacterium]